MDKEEVTVFVAAQTQPGNVAVKLSQLLCMITTGGEIKKKVVSNKEGLTTATLTGKPRTSLQALKKTCGR